MAAAWVWQIGFGDVKANQGQDIHVVAEDLDTALNKVATLRRDRSAVTFVQRKQEVNVP